MTMRTFWMLVLVVGGLLPTLAGAVQVDGLYRTEVAVADQSAAERERALQEGLKTVLVKVSGRANVVNEQPVIDAMARAESYMTKFGYRREAAADGSEQLKIDVSYSQAVVDGLLRRARLPIWPADRPELLVWMVVDLPGEGQRHVSRELLPEAHQALTQQMALRAAPLLAPLLDLEDQLTLSAGDAWRFQRDKLAAAAKRYHADHWLVLRFYQASNGRYRATVQVEAGAHSGLDNIDAESLPELISKATDLAVDRMATGFAFVPNVRSEEITLLLEEVSNYSDYKAAIELFDGLEMVRSVRVATVDGEQLDLRLAIDGSLDGLLRMLRRNKQLREYTDADAGADIGARVYRGDISGHFCWQ